VSGGQFTAQQGPSASVVVNFHRVDPSGSGDTAPTPHQHGHPRPLRRRRNNDSRENQHLDFDSVTAQQNQTAKRSNVLYEEHLMWKGRGYPLWIPSSNMNLPIPYRAKGVCIGDVGIITAYGGFDFLFNICLPSNDPINPEILPDGFVPISPPLLRTDVREFREFTAGSYLASSSVSKSGGDGTELTFESTASEGAILTMPDGAFHQELGNIARFRDYVAIHAENWYKYVNGPLGREAQNGDVRLVIGCDKSTSWGMATFSNVSQESNFRLQFRTLEERGRLPTRSTYTWDHSGMAEVRVGPDQGENDELGATNEQSLRNQCLFMRTLNTFLEDGVWKRLHPQRVVELQAQEKSQSGRDAFSIQDLNNTHGPTEFRSSLRGTSQSGTAMRNRSPLITQQYESVESQDLNNDHTKQLPDGSRVTIEHSPTAPNAMHPSTRMNEFLLRKIGEDIKMVITSDKDWQDIWSSDPDWELMGPNALISKILETKFIRLTNGVAYLEPIEHTEATRHLERYRASAILQGFTSGWTMEDYLFGSSDDRGIFLDELIAKLGSKQPVKLLEELDGHPNRLLLIDEIMVQERDDYDFIEGVREGSPRDPELSHFHSQKQAHRVLMRFWRFNEREDLDEAIWLHEKILLLLSTSSYRYLEVLLSLCSALYKRFRLLGQVDDLQTLMNYLEKQRNLDILSLLSSAESALNERRQTAGLILETPPATSPLKYSEFRSELPLHSLTPLSLAAISNSKPIETAEGLLNSTSARSSVMQDVEDNHQSLTRRMPDFPQLSSSLAPDGRSTQNMVLSNFFRGLLEPNTPALAASTSPLFPPGERR